MSAKDIGERIKVARLSRNLTQAQLAEAVGVKPSTVGMWENGRREPDSVTLDALADVYNVPTTYFFERGAESAAHLTQRDQDRLEALHQNPRLGLLFDRQSRMSESDVEMMLALADRILKEREPYDD